MGRWGVGAKKSKLSVIGDGNLKIEKLQAKSKMHLFYYEPGYIILCIGNLTEETSYVSKFEFSTGL
jgi:hypothetical protein